MKLKAIETECYWQKSNLSEPTEISCHYETFITAKAIFWKQTELICTPNIIVDKKRKKDWS